MLAQRAVEDSPRWTRAVEDHAVPTPEEVMSKLGGSTYNHRSMAARRSSLNTRLARRLNELEKKYDSQFRADFVAIRELLVEPGPKVRRIGFKT